VFFAEAKNTGEQFAITREHGTERSFCGIFHDNHKDGLYLCIACGLPLAKESPRFPA